MRLPIKMPPTGDKRRWRYWISNYWRRWVLVLVFVLMAGHLLISQVSLSDLSRHAQAAREPPVRTPNQGDRHLNMIVTPWTANHSSVRPSSAASDEYLHAEKLLNGQLLKPVEKKTQRPMQSPSNEQTTPSPTDHDRATLWMQQQELKYRQRSQRLRQVCQQRHVTAADPLVILNHNQSTIIRRPGIDEDPPKEQVNVEHFTLASSFQTMGCFVNKVASSSLVSAFLLVNGYGPSFDSPHSLAPFLRPRSVQDFLFSNATFFKFMLVRHPMERLLSCYIDKMVESPHWSLPAFRRHVQDTARQIMKKRSTVKPSASNFGPETTRIGRTLKAIDSQRRPTMVGAQKPVKELDKEQISRFIRQISMDGAPGPGLGSRPPAAANASAINVKVTFEEFLEFILATDLLGNGYDSHWVPFWRYCSPCNVPYHVIGKLETAVDDFQYIWNKTGLDTKVPIPWVNKKKSKGKEDLERKYYSSISRELILRVYRRFRLDFEMFDYSINDILVKAGYEPIIEDQWK